jgi:hypothetical protein
MRVDSSPCECGSPVYIYPGDEEGTFDKWCPKCCVYVEEGRASTLRLVWVRTRAVSYSREVPTSKLRADGRIEGEDAWWEVWP